MGEALAALRATLGDAVVQTGEAIEPGCHTDWTRHAPARPLAFLRPRSTSEVADALRICNREGQSVVPQGGMTGLAGGAVPRSRDIAVSLARMQGVEALDAAGATMTVLAGTTLQTVQQAAEKANLYFPLDLGSRGSCQIGGNIATNAGGSNVLRYGMTRELVLGLEAVLADGTVLRSLNRMMKNNAGYDLKQCFIGAEGTLGVITRAVLKLYPRLPAVRTVLCALPTFDAAIRLLRALQQDPGGIAAYELMWPEFYRLGVSWLPSRRAPLPESYALYALFTVESAVPDESRVATVLEKALREGGVLDAVGAQSLAEARALWAIREATAEVPTRLSPVNLDVSVPASEMQGLVDRCRRQLAAKWPEHRSYFFGHVADGNLHLTVDARTIPGVERGEIYRLVFECVREAHGSISGEHGIGLLKRDYLPVSRSPEEIETMRRLKRALDPNSIMNPGKIFAGNEGGATPSTMAVAA
ncbi:MAG: FAD-binding oxidoreductase [Burkholderiales bacterium]|nr:FAD-binding oxidoreductase [Burkholderiales bacterium]